MFGGRSIAYYQKLIRGKLEKISAKKASISKKKKNYKNNHKKEILKRHQIYNQKNKKSIAEKQKNYDLKNKKAVNKKQTLYNQKNRSIINQKQQERRDLYLNKDAKILNKMSWD